MACWWFKVGALQIYAKIHIQQWESYMEISIEIENENNMMHQSLVEMIWLKNKWPQLWVTLAPPPTPQKALSFGAFVNSSPNPSEKSLPKRDKMRKSEGVGNGKRAFKREPEKKKTTSKLCWIGGY